MNAEQDISPCYAIYLAPSTTTTPSSGGATSPDSTIHAITSKLSTAHKTPPIPSGIFLAKLPLGPLDPIKETLQLQIDAFKAEELDRRQYPHIPMTTHPGSHSLLVNASMDPLMAPNPYYDPSWTPRAIRVPVLGLWSGTAEGGNDRLEVETGCTYIKLEMKETFEVRSLIGALQTDLKAEMEKTADRRSLMALLSNQEKDDDDDDGINWSLRFEIIRSPEYFQCPATGIVLLKSEAEKMSVGLANKIVEGMKQEGIFVEADSEGGMAKFGGMEEMEFDRIVVMKGGEDGVWEKVAECSVV
ncbi:hypothetical protein P7C70_g463, partial [Phenoliferia sp. Uapishka_3]